MKQIIVLLVFWSILPAQAQSLKVGFKGNLGLSFVSNQVISVDQSIYTTPPQLSYGVEFPVYLRLTPAIWLRSGIGIQNKRFSLRLASIGSPAISVQGLMKMGMNAYALQLPLLACFSPKTNEQIMIEAGILFSRYTLTSQTLAGSSPSGLINQTVSGIEINVIATSFDVTYRPELYAAFSYFLPSTTHIRQQLQVSFEYGLKQSSQVVFEGEVITDNDNIPFAGNLSPNFGTLKLSYTVFPFW